MAFPQARYTNAPSAMTTTLRSLPFLFLSLALLACGTSEPSAQEESSSNQSLNRLVVSELSVPVGGLTAYDLVNQYKSHWLQKRSETVSLQQTPQIQVYVDNPGGQAGSISALKRINANNISVIEYFSPSEAQFRFGMGNSVGAILVHTKSGS